MSGDPGLRPLMSRDSSWIGTGMQIFGMTFVLMWGLAMLWFPSMKGLPLGYVPVVLGILAGATVLWKHEPLSRRLEAIPDGWFWAGLMALTVVLRAAALIVFPLDPANDHEMFLRLALSMRRGDGYALAYGPSAFFPPGMPLLLTAWFYLVPVGVVTAKLLGFLIGVALVPLTGYVGSRLAGQLRGRWAALVLATSPTAVFYSATIGYELLLGGLLLTIALIGTRTLGRLSARTVVTMGLLSGLAALVKPTSLLVPAILALAWIDRLSVRQTMAHGVAVALVMLAVVAPWTLRNWRVLGSPVLISTNGGPVLYAANNPDSVGLAIVLPPLPGEHDELSRDRIRREAAIRWMTAHPIEWLQLAARKIAYTWGTSSSIMSYISYDRMPATQENLAKAVLNIGWAALFVWCASATWHTTVWRDPRLRIANLFITTLFITHMWFEALSRHHVTVLPMLALIASARLSAPGTPAPSGGSATDKAWPQVGTS